MIRLILQLAGTFFKIGLFTLGGGIAIIALVQQEMVARGWLTNAQFADILGIAQMTPGPIGVNAATFVGYRVTALQGHGVLLAILASAVATLAVTAPSVIGVEFGGTWFERNRGKPWVMRVFSILRPLVAGLVSAAGILLMLDAFGADCLYALGAVRFDAVSLVLLVVAVVVTCTHRFSPLWALALGAAVGLVRFFL